VKHARDATGVFNYTLHGIVVDDAELSAMNL
jgi:hypothetical protein